MTAPAAANAASVAPPSPPVRTPPARDTGPIETWARAGLPLVIPFDPAPAQLREGLVPARLSGGAALYAPLWWIGPGTSSPARVHAASGSESTGAALIATRAATWMGVGADWEAFTARAAAQRPALPPNGRWYLVIDIPPEAEGQDLLLDGRRTNTGWIRRVPFDPPRRVQAPIAGWTEACLVAARRSPLDRWRARLAADEPLVAPGPVRDEFVDKTIESLAEQIEAQWSEALDRLAAADAALATEVRRRLSLVVDFGAAQAPAWPTDDASLGWLGLALLSPSLTPPERTQCAREWLAEQPRYAAWVADDAALLDAASGLPAAHIAGLILDPGAGPTVMMVSRPHLARPEEIAPLTPTTVGTSLVGLAAAPVDDTGLVVQVAGWAARRSVVPRAVEARPPGLSLGPFFEDWSLSTWLSSSCDPGDTRGGPSPAGLGLPVNDDSHRTAAMLLAQEVPGTGTPETTSRRWTLYIECRDPGVDTRAQHDEVLISLAGNGGEVTLRVFPDGQVVTSRGGSSRVPAERSKDRWMVWVPLPEGVLADSSWIRLGLTRTDASGLRSSWPRPMFPWDDRPAHAAIGLTQWSGLPAQRR